MAEPIAEPAAEIDAPPTVIRLSEHPTKTLRSRRRPGQGHGPDNQAATGKRRNKIAEAWISYPLSMIESPAMRALSHSAIRVMHRLEIEHMAHGGAENGHLIATHDQFKEWGVPQNSISSAIRELVALGFVEITRNGAAGNAQYRRPANYRLTYVNNKSRAQPTHEWRKIKTTEDAEELAVAARATKDARARAAGKRGQQSLKLKAGAREIA